MDKLQLLWAEQFRYNERIRSKSNHPNDKSFWAKQYILGLISELNEVLEEIDWKVHRKLTTDQDRHNLGRELADLTKYTWCLWELFHFTPDEMLNFIAEKNTELEQKYKQEFGIGYLSPDVPVLIADIDGTLGDWRKAFASFIKDQTGLILPPDAATSMAIETDLGVPYPHYVALKKHFESNGGYKLLEPYRDAVLFIHQAADQGWDIRCWTARPGKRYGRIWSDTREWLDAHDIGQFITELHLGGEERIYQAGILAAKGHRVILLEDDPTLALRAASTGLHVLLRNQPYNVGLQHPNIIRVDNFNHIDLRAEKWEDIKIL